MNVTELTKKKLEKTVTRQQAEAAIKVLLAWAGQNPEKRRSI
jgi:GTP cyclohydrolase I